MADARWTISLANMGMRALSLGARFVLSIYMVQSLGYAALGFFGLIAGLAGAAPAVLGFGLSYHANREIVAAPRAVGYRLLRDRLAFSAVIVLLAMPIVVTLLATGLLPLPHRPVITGMILALEYLAFDLHLGLINLRRPVAANFLLFVRSASWILPVVILGMLVPAYRTIDTVLSGWLAALLLNFMLLPVLIRDAPFHALARMPVDLAGMLARIRRTPLIYANDLSTSGQTYLDRFLVAHLIGIAATGVYTLYFSVTQGLYVLVATAVTQLSMPKLATARTVGGLSGWRRMILAEAGRAMLFAMPIVGAALAAALVVLPAIGFGTLAVAPFLFALMAATGLVKPLADLANTGLYSLGLDRTLACINIGGVALSALLAIVLIRLFGLVGTGISALTTQIVLILLRVGAARRHLAAADC